MEPVDPGFERSRRGEGWKLIPLYTLYSPSHEVLFQKFFLPSLPAGVDLRAVFLDSTGDGYYGTASYWRGIVRKVELILEAIEAHWGGVFIWSDADVQFFGEIARWAGPATRDCDICFQIDGPGPALCAGFFFCRANESTRWLWRQALEFVNVPEHWREDQAVIRERLSGESAVRHGLLPPVFMGGGTFTGKLWHRGQELPVPAGVQMHHADFTCGVPNKVAQCEYVAGKVRRAEFTPAHELAPIIDSRIISVEKFH